MKFFGLGLQKTGTTSLGDYYEHCGIRRLCGGSISLSQHVLRNQYHHLDPFLSSYDGFEDAPWFMIFEYLYSRYPNAKYILTVRFDPLIWLKSFIRHTQLYGPQFPFRQAYGYASPVGHEREFIDHYLSHIRRVESFFSSNDSSFLRVCLEDPSAHDELVSFLGRNPSEFARIHSNSSQAKSSYASYSRIIRRNAVYFGRCVFDRLGLPVV